MYKILTRAIDGLSVYCRGCCDEKIYLVTDTDTSQERVFQEVTREAMNESVLYGGHRELHAQQVHVENLRQVILYIRLQRVTDKARDVLEHNTSERVLNKSGLLDEIVDRLQYDETVE